MAELVIVDCVSMFYEEGKGGEKYRKKSKFRCKINGNEKDVMRPKSSICEFAGLRETAKKFGLDESLDIQLNRGQRRVGVLNEYRLKPTDS